jgi:hypothetical protein
LRGHAGEGFMFESEIALVCVASRPHRAFSRCVTNPASNPDEKRLSENFPDNPYFIGVGGLIGNSVGDVVEYRTLGLPAGQGG